MQRPADRPDHDYSLSYLKREAYYGGEWRHASGQRRAELFSPGSGGSLGTVADCGAEDVDAAVKAAQAGFQIWRRTAPKVRANTLRQFAAVIRANAAELAMIDALDCGNPVSEMIHDAEIAADQIEYFAGLTLEAKGFSLPMAEGHVNYTLREPLGVVARILPFNHPMMFTAGKIAAPLAAGNAVIIKPPEQAPLSSLRVAELAQDIFPAGVFNVLPGGKEAGARLAEHPDVALIALIGSVPTGKAVMTSAAKVVKHTLLELGGKNALIAYPDADPVVVAEAIIRGMNFTWCGQSCGSTSRAFIHRDLYDAVLPTLKQAIARYRPGLPTDPATTMGAIISASQLSRVKSYIDASLAEGAELISGGGAPTGDDLASGFYLEPTVFRVTRDHTIFREEIFGPVLSLVIWDDEEQMLSDVNSVDYGLTASVWTSNLQAAHRAIAAIDAGYIWVNDVSRHYLGAPFGGFKRSGIGREECLEELLTFTREKNVHVKFA
jgi:betaine-aldehyde dehydrogenase